MTTPSDGYRVDPERLRALIASLRDTVTRLSRSAMELDTALLGTAPPGHDEVSMNSYRQLVRMSEDARASIDDRQARLLTAIATLQAQLDAYERAERSAPRPTA